MNESQYEMIIYWDKTDKIFIVDVPELPGCMAHGKSKKEAIENAENCSWFLDKNSQRRLCSNTQSKRTSNVCLRSI